ncbi:hypothetical protein TRFO_30366 [Tritrichomonas foetus]|uniref:Uncharacterized protein n=1 Tax=Tritrichomonas foetus TaxID=1144522 RepID=A0A1J4JUU6_9EUKA|nr:hypothetical protein TRFO_30366 [Tritrichomonas foetus]|eukprot:OHT02482.1 hypothetical protein TRFO_30366 [Tritrichomonas foetus]
MWRTPPLPSLPPMSARAQGNLLVFHNLVRDEIRQTFLDLNYAKNYNADLLAQPITENDQMIPVLDQLSNLREHVKWMTRDRNTLYTNFTHTLSKVNDLFSTLLGGMKFTCYNDTLRLPLEDFRKQFLSNYDIALHILQKQLVVDTNNEKATLYKNMLWQLTPYIIKFLADAKVESTTPSGHMISQEDVNAFCNGLEALVRQINTFGTTPESIIAAQKSCQANIDENLRLAESLTLSETKLMETEAELEKLQALIHNENPQQFAPSQEFLQLQQEYNQSQNQITTLNIQVNAQNSTIANLKEQMQCYAD